MEDRKQSETIEEPFFPDVQEKDGSIKQKPFPGDPEALKVGVEVLKEVGPSPELEGLEKRVQALEERGKGVMDELPASLPEVLEAAREVVRVRWGEDAIERVRRGESVTATSRSWDDLKDAIGELLDALARSGL